MEKKVIFLLVLVFISFGIAITSNAIENSTISDVTIRPLTIYYDSFDGNTSEFSDYNLSTLQDFPNTTLEKTGYGKVDFLENLNFSLIGGENAIVDLDSYFNISDNLIYANPSYLPYMNKSAEMNIYGLTYEDPVVVNGVDECITCEILSYSGGTLTFNTTLFEGPFYARNASDFIEEPVCGNGVLEDGEECDDGNTVNGDGCSSSCLIEEDEGDTGGGDITVPDEEEEEPSVREKSFYIEPELLVVQMNKGEYFQRNIEIFNDGGVDLNITLYFLGETSRFVFPEKRVVEVEAGSSEVLRYDIYFSKTIPSDVYTGKVLFSSGDIRFEQNVILDVQDKNALFDIKAEVLKRYLFPGARARANVSILNMGDLRNFDVAFEYRIIDFEKNAYSAKKEDFAMNISYSNIFFLDLPEDIPIGDYLFYAKVTHIPSNVSATAYDTITVETVSYWTWILLIVIILLIGIYIYYRYNKDGFKSKAIKKVQKKNSQTSSKEKTSPRVKEVPKIPDEFD